MGTARTLCAGGLFHQLGVDVAEQTAPDIDNELRLGWPKQVLIRMSHAGVIPKGVQRVQDACRAAQDGVELSGSRADFLKLRVLLTELLDENGQGVLAPVADPGFFAEVVKMSV